jgi:hypothetical protein
MKKYPIYNETKGHSLRGLRIAEVLAEDKLSAIRTFKGSLYLEDPDVTFIYELNSLPEEGTYRVGEALYEVLDNVAVKYTKAYWDNILTATTLTNIGNLQTVGGELNLGELATAKQDYYGKQGRMGKEGAMGKLLPTATPEPPTMQAPPTMQGPLGTQPSDDYLNE